MLLNEEIAKGVQSMTQTTDAHAGASQGFWLSFEPEFCLRRSPLTFQSKLDHSEPVFSCHGSCLPRTIIPCCYPLAWGRNWKNDTRESSRRRTKLDRVGWSWVCCSAVRKFCLEELDAWLWFRGVYLRENLFFECTKNCRPTFCSRILFESQLLFANPQTARSFAGSY